MRLTNPLWYLAALLFVIGSAIGAGVIAASAFDSIKTANVISINESVDAAGKTLAVYSSSSGERDVTCYATGPDDKRIAIDEPVPEITNTSNGTTWHLITLLKEGKDGLKVTCETTGTGQDTDRYGYTVVDDFLGPANNGQGIAILGFTVGAGLAAYVFWCRRLVRKQTDEAEPTTEQ